jgi:hypothetical protein
MADLKSIAIQIKRSLLPLASVEELMFTIEALLPVAMAELVKDFVKGLYPEVAALFLTDYVAGVIGADSKIDIGFLGVYEYGMNPMVIIPPFPEVRSGTIIFDWVADKQLLEYMSKTEGMNGYTLSGTELIVKTNVDTTNIALTVRGYKIPLATDIPYQAVPLLIGKLVQLIGRPKTDEQRNR